ATGKVRLLDSSSVTDNTATGAGGGIDNYRGRVRLRSSSSVTDNTATGAGGGIHNTGTVSACDSTGTDEWIGVISPNTPDDPPTPTQITCS
ncbi:MAG: hypothetical protein OEV62_09760, partial [Actinomycetota bacterium]|nr:hypothetical protein [Actinomycetota bacterium]